ncbi:hypothetical protein [Marinobacter sp. SS21]|uniref:hypothetical protein n=1 Tax=Marinobacter sp. SS21 TaxID=2979460 RepID=UPI00233152C5|nr:hypothetical protein [Marinobacter sp. SS21]MDC0662348.1 hypothetical protein [Marinobacter sp. SS21]
MQPVLSLGQSTVEATSQNVWAAHAAMMDCCQAVSPDTSEHVAQGMACNDMTLADCAFYASIGSCGASVPALLQNSEGVIAPSISRLNARDLPNGYLSIVLDTLTPPPNSSLG